MSQVRSHPSIEFRPARLLGTSSVVVVAVATLAQFAVVGLSAAAPATGGITGHGPTSSTTVVQRASSGSASAATVTTIRGLVAQNRVASLAARPSNTQGDRVRAATWWINSPATEQIRWTAPVMPTKVPTGYRWTGYRIRLSSSVSRTAGVGAQALDVKSTRFGTGFPKVELLFTRAKKPTRYGPSVGAVRIDAPISWLSIGDSYSAGTGGSGTYRGPAGGTIGFDPKDRCRRSTGAWAPQAVDLLGGAAYIDLVHKACMGAVIADVATQAKQANSSTDIITLSAGGNDLGFATLAGSCAYVIGKGDCDLSSYLPKQTYATIQERLVKLVWWLRTSQATRAKVLVATYPSLLPPSQTITHNLRVGSCWTGQLLDSQKVTLPISFRADRARTLAGQIQPDLNASITRAAAKAGGIAVDLSHSADGHAVTDRSPWINPISCTRPLTPDLDSLHPNLSGYASMAKLLIRKIDTPQPNRTVESWPADLTAVGAFSRSFPSSDVQSDLLPNGGLGACVASYPPNAADGDLPVRTKFGIGRDGSLTQFAASSPDCEPYGSPFSAWIRDFDNAVYGTTQHQGVTVVEKRAASGRTLWQQADSTTSPTSAMAVDRRGLVTYGASDGVGRLQIRDAATGRITATTELPGMQDVAAGVVRVRITLSPTVILIDNTYNDAVWVDRRTGRVLRTRDSTGGRSFFGYPLTGGQLMIITPRFGGTGSGACTFTLEASDAAGFRWGRTLDVGHVTYCESRESHTFVATGDGGGWLLVAGTSETGTWYRIGPGGGLGPSATVTCHVTCFDFGSHSSPGDSWVSADQDGRLAWTAQDADGHNSAFTMDPSGNLRTIPLTQPGRIDNFVLGYGQLWLLTTNTEDDSAVVTSQPLDTTGDVLATARYR